MSLPDIVWDPATRVASNTAAEPPDASDDLPGPQLRLQRGFGLRDLTRGRIQTARDTPPDPQMPLATKPGWGRGPAPEFHSVDDCLCLPLPPWGRREPGGGRVLCLGGDRPHSEHSFSVPTCLFACFKSEAPGTAFSFCFLLVASLEGLSWSWNHKLDKQHDTPHPSNHTPQTPPRAGRPRLSGPRLPVGPSTLQPGQMRPAPDFAFLGGRQRFPRFTGQARLQWPLRPGRRGGHRISDAS